MIHVKNDTNQYGTEGENDKYDNKDEKRKIKMYQ